MSAEDGEVDTSRKTVKTFVPAYQKDEWKRHADDLDMSQSEFVRTMVQAGRRDFEIDGSVSAGSSPNAADSDAASGAPGGRPTADDASDGDSGDSDGNGPQTGSDSGGGADLETHVVGALSDADHLSWDELLERLTSDIEDRLDETLQELQADNRVQYSGRHDGYVLVEGGDGD